jgi:hypothetical protein
MFKPALGWRKRKIAMMHITKTWVEDGKIITEIIPAENVYKREWVGLTPEERKQLWYEWENGHVVEATEAKLKAKNFA